MSTTVTGKLVCALCRYALPDEHFHRESAEGYKGRRYRASYCKKCAAVYHRDWRTHKRLNRLKQSW